MKVAVLGSGVVGDTLTKAFAAVGHQVVQAKRAEFEQAARGAELVVLAVKGTAAEAAVELCKSALDGKVVIDTCNPIADAAPVNGVLAFFTGPNESLMERLQKRAPAAKFVKAFSSVGSGHMFKPKFAARPTMFICGNDAGAKQKVAGVLEQFEWDCEDMGKIEASRAIEPLCMLWCIPGLAQNKWNHAFKLLKA
jgi:predicted dinucleotide-binding enzyme